MFEFKIGGAYEATVLLDKGWPTKTVSVIQESADFRSTGPSHLVVHMSDVFSPHMSPHAPTMDHLLTILDHTKDLKDDDRLLVNCWAGQSRSTAAAIGILIQHGFDYLTAFEMVLEERDIALPNGLLIQHIDSHFGLGGELCKKTADHRKSELSKPYITANAQTAQQTIDQMRAFIDMLK